MTGTPRENGGSPSGRRMAFRCDLGAASTQKRDPVVSIVSDHPTGKDKPVWTVRCRVLLSSSSTDASPSE